MREMGGDEKGDGKRRGRGGKGEIEREQEERLQGA